MPFSKVWGGCQGPVPVPKRSFIAGNIHVQDPHPKEYNALTLHNTNNAHSFIPCHDSDYIGCTMCESPFGVDIEHIFVEVQLWDVSGSQSSQKKLERPIWNRYDNAECGVFFAYIYARI